MSTIKRLIKRPGFLLIVIACLTGCRKFAESPSTVSSNPAYLRVFNVIPNAQTPFNSAAAAPFFTFLFDPKLDASGTPSGATITGDWLGARHLFSSSYPLEEGNSLGASLDTFVTHNITYEYPGSAHVLTAPAINGYDLSAWAQVPSGKHRVQFISRPQTDTPFANLSATIRKAVLIDTVIDLQPGEVYTLEAVALDLDNNQYGAYLRQEQFAHQSFSDTSLYVGFFNLTGKKSAVLQTWLTDSLQISCTYRSLDDISYNAGVTTPAYNIVAGLNKAILTTVTRHMATTTTYVPLPLLPEKYYFDDQGVFRTYGPLNNFTNFGTLPSVSFYFQSPPPATANIYQLDCDLDPALINNYQPFQLGGSTRQYLPSILLFSTSASKPQIYPSLTIMEVVYGTVYMTQIQPAFYQQPK